MRTSALLTYAVLLGWFAFIIASTTGCEGLAGDAGGPEGAPAVFQELSFKDAGELAAREKKVLLVDYTASWCPPCKMMERDTWPDRAVVAWVDQHAVAIQLDLDRNRNLSAQHGINAIPAMILFRDGEEIGRVIGYRDPPQLLAWLRDTVG